MTNSKTRRLAGDDADCRRAFPQQRHYLLLALLFAGIAIYGSLVPFHFVPLEWEKAVAVFHSLMGVPLHFGSRSDFVANVLLSIPIAYCALAALTVDDRSVGVRFFWLAIVVLGCYGFATALEFMQVWFPPRNPSRNDIVAQTLGAIVGCGLWMAWGNSATAWIRSYFSAQKAGSQFELLLQFYLAGLLLYSVLPLDLTISPADIVHEYRDGKIVLVPELPDRFDLLTAYELCRDTAIWLPVGMLAAIWLVPAGQPCRSLGRSVLWGAVPAVGSEFAQVFVNSRYTSTGDVALAMLGVTAGAWWMRRRRLGKAASWLFATPATPVRDSARAWAWGGVALALALGFAVISCIPNQPVESWGQAEQRFVDALHRVPFVGLFYGSPLDVIFQVVWKTGSFALIAGAFAMMLEQLGIGRRRRSAAIAITVCSAAGVALAIELVQVFLPPHVPDVSDVLLCAAGAVVGLLTVFRLLDAEIDSPPDRHPRSR